MLKLGKKKSMVKREEKDPSLWLYMLPPKLHCKTCFVVNKVIPGKTYMENKELGKHQKKPKFIINLKIQNK